MHQSWTSRGLWTLSTLLLLLSVAALVWGALGNPEPECPGDATLGPAAVVAAPPPAATVTPVAQLAMLWQRDLRQPLDGSAAANPAGATVPLLSVRLVGTAVDEQQSCAVFLDAQQHPIVLTTGQSIEGLRLTAIESRKVLLEAQNRRVELVVPEQSSASGVVPAPGGIDGLMPPPVPARPPGVQGIPAVLPARRKP